MTPMSLEDSFLTLPEGFKPQGRGPRVRPCAGAPGAGPRPGKGGRGGRGGRSR